MAFLIIFYYFSSLSFSLEDISEITAYVHKVLENENFLRKTFIRNLGILNLAQIFYLCNNVIWNNIKKGQIMWIMIR